MAADVEANLAWERRGRRFAVPGAVLAGLLPVAAGIANSVIFEDAPRVSIISSLQRAIAPGPVGDLESLHLPLYAFYQDNFLVLLAAALLNAVGLVAAGGVLTYIGHATRARRPQFKAYAVWLPLVAGVLFALATILLVVITNLGVGSLLEGPRTVAAVSDWQAGALSFGRWFEGFARLLLGIAFVIVCLNAMRVGLLTRFMGVLGIISGGLLVIPLGGPLPVVQAFWFVALAVSIGERFPGAVPPAWRTGRAEPWPSQKEARAMAERAERETDPSADGRKRRGAARVAAERGAPPPPPRVPRSATGKRKRKHRG